MKLWKKISLICGVILIVVVSVCSGILLMQTRQQMLSLKYSSTEQKLGSLTRSFAEMMNHYYSENDSEVVNRSLARYCFSYYADASAVLLIGDDTVYSRTDIYPEEYLSISQHDSAKQFTGKIGGRHILICGSAVDLLSVGDSICAVYLVEDITPVYDRITNLFWMFLGIGSSMILVGLLLIMVMVRYSLHPLSQLQTTAARIAEGNYQDRAKIPAKDEVGALAVDFNRMADAVEQHIQELTEQARRQELFIGGVTHEFKTPLTALILHADLLQNTCMEEEEQLTSLRHIEQQAKWLERLVQKMLKLITLKQALVLKSVSVPELLEQVRDTVTEKFHACGVSLEIQCEASNMTLDADLMGSALVNLTENACKASAAGQTVILRAYDSTLEVVDNGIGIPHDALSRITEPFYMVDKSRSKKHGGVGLGLALVQEIVKAHGASLEFDSTPGQGTTARVHLHQ
ncbi:MAG: sensor histidine kinase [Faecousia sp.]